MENKDFDLKNLPIEAQDSSITKDDFVLVQADKKVHEQKFQTKPTTFFKDSVKRFAKNKSSVIAACILGSLLVLSFLIPAVDKNDTKSSHPYMIYLEPKLFNSGSGVWDGTKDWVKIPVDVSKDPEGVDKETNWWPNPTRFKQNAVTNKTFSDVTYTNGQSEFGKEGYIQFGYYSNISETKPYVEFKTQHLTKDVDIDEDIYLSKLDTYDLTKLEAKEGKNESVKIPENYVLGKTALYFNYNVTDTSGEKPVIYTKSIKLIDYKEVHNIGSDVDSVKEGRVNLSEIIKNDSDVNYPSEHKFEDAYFSLRMENTLNEKNTCTLIRGIEFEYEGTNQTLGEEITAPNFSDATQCIVRSSKLKGTNTANPQYWSSTGVKNIYLSKIVYCNFTYDSYEATFGTMLYSSFPLSTLDNYKNNGWLDYYIVSEDDASGKFHVIEDSIVFDIKDPVNCPVESLVTAVCDEDNGQIFVDVMLCYYKYYGYSKMPRFIMGTDKSGIDMFKYVFEGLRTSLLLGLMTSAVCFIFGLAYGAISGYFGGTVDLAMERFTDILSGVPWIVVMTLAILKLGSTFWTFALSLCLTGWIGTAATTRTQFYRFRGREYVLASRTLGASDARLIAKHILPNAMGTIITAAVLMIPSVIFSEATISYLGLGLKNLSSLGVILSNNQAELTTNSYLLIFPSIIIALLMISFNLFGNGLRDAVNPSLKGEE